MSAQLEDFVKWLEGYNEFCHANSKKVVFKKV